MTMIQVDKTWIYSFGGVSQNYNRNSKNLVVERINTQLLQDNPADIYMNQAVIWEEICLSSDVYTSCC